MKKRKVLFIICLFLFVILFMTFIKNKKIGSYEVMFVDEMSSNEKIIKVCVVNPNNNFEIIDVKIDKESDEIKAILQLFDENRNKLPLNYRSVLKGNISYHDITRYSDRLVIQIDNFDKNSDFNAFCKALIWSYRYLQIKEIEIKYDNQTYLIDDNETINEVYLNTNYNNYQIFYELTDYGFVPFSVYHNLEKSDLVLEMLKSNYHFSYNLKSNYGIDDIEIVIKIKGNFNSKEKEKISSIIKYNLLSLKVADKIKIEFV